MAPALERPLYSINFFLFNQILLDAILDFKLPSQIAKFHSYILHGNRSYTDGTLPNVDIAYVKCELCKAYFDENCRMFILL